MELYVFQVEKVANLSLIFFLFAFMKGNSCAVPYREFFY